MTTEEQYSINIENYKKDPNFCPICESENIIGIAWNMDIWGNYAYRGCKCENCQSKWEEEFILHQVINLEKGDKDAVEQGIYAVDTGDQGPGII